MRFAALTLSVVPLLAQTPWHDLFDGKSLAGWRGPVSPAFLEASWRIDDGVLHPVPVLAKADLWSAATYRNFVLEFEFRLDPKANGGIKYLVQRSDARLRRGNQGPWLRVENPSVEPGDRYVESTGGLEFQIVDDEADEAKDPKRRTGAMYSLVAPVDPPPVGPSVFHSGRIVVQGNRIEHHLNGRRIVQVTLGSPEMEAAWEECKRNDIRQMRPLERRETPIAITHHGSLVRYRNVRIQSLP
jgi:hypothetical protein